MPTSLLSRQIVFLLCGLSIIGIGYKMVLPTNHLSTSQPLQSPTAIPTQTSNSLSASQSSVNDLLFQFPMQKCSLLLNSTHATIYSKDTNLRIDFIGPGLFNMSNIVYTKDTFYAWNANSQTGLRMSLTEIEHNILLSGYVKNLLSQLQQQTYTCESNSISDALFIVPKNITFSSRNSKL